MDSPHKGQWRRAFFDLRLKKQLSKQPRRRWLRRHRHRNWIRWCITLCGGYSDVIKNIVTLWKSAIVAIRICWGTGVELSWDFFLLKSWGHFLWLVSQHVPSLAPPKIHVKTLGTKNNGRHFTAHNLKYVVLNENIRILFAFISTVGVCCFKFYNLFLMVQFAFVALIPVMAWHRIGEVTDAYMRHQISLSLVDLPAQMAGSPGLI